MPTSLEMPGALSDESGYESARSSAATTPCRRSQSHQPEVIRDDQLNRDTEMSSLNDSAEVITECRSELGLAPDHESPQSFSFTVTPPSSSLQVSTIPSAPSATSVFSLQVEGQEKTRDLVLPPKRHLPNHQPSPEASASSSSEKGSSVLPLPDKRRYEEVDYSFALRQKLYQKDQLVNELKTRLKGKAQATPRLQALAIQRERDTIEDHYATLYNGALWQAQQELESRAQTASVAIQNLLKQRQDEVAVLRAQVEEHERERLQLQTQVREVQDRASKHHETEMTRLRQQLEDAMHTRLDDVIRSSNETLTNLMNQKEREMQTKTTELETRMQQEIHKLMVDREREMAAMEQRHAHSSGPRLDSPLQSQPANRVQSGPRFDPPPQSQPANRVQSTHATPSLDAIKRIKKSRGISHRTRLVGISVEPEEPHVEVRTEAPHKAPNSNSNGSRNDQGVPTDSPPSSMADIVTKAVETALRNVLGEKNSPQPNRRSPRRKRAEDNEIALEKATEPRSHRDFMLNQVRRLFKSKFAISQDADFIGHEIASADDVHDFEHEDGPGPDSNLLAFDLRRNHSSPWNSAVIEILLLEFQQMCEEEQWLVTKSDIYVREMLKSRYNKLRTVWIKAQPKLTQDGVLETAEEVETRLVSEMEKQGKASRQGTRRRNKYHRRIATLVHIVKLKTETMDDDLPVWQWLFRLIEILGEHGMSSEESSVENNIEHVLRVKRMEWRRCMDRELDVIDTERLLDCDIFAPQGAKPVKRVRASDNPVSSRDAVAGLPRTLYDNAWISGISGRELEALSISSENFVWMKVATA